MRNLICDCFFWLAERAQTRAEHCIDPFWRDAWSRRSKFWADCELLFAGLIGFAEFRRRRKPQPPKTTITQARRPS